jgi:hypothetical protein
MRHEGRKKNHVSRNCLDRLEWPETVLVHIGYLADRGQELAYARETLNAPGLGCGIVQEEDGRNHLVRRYADIWPVSEILVSCIAGGGWRLSDEFVFEEGRLSTDQVPHQMQYARIMRELKESRREVTERFYTVGPGQRVHDGVPVVAIRSFADLTAHPICFYSPSSDLGGRKNSTQTQPAVVLVPSLGSRGDPTEYHRP